MTIFHKVIEGDFFFLRMVQGYIEVGSIHYPAGLAVDGFQDIFQAGSGNDRPADLVQSGKFGDTALMFTAQEKVFQSHGRLAGDGLQEALVIGAKGRRFVTLHRHHPDGPFAGDEGHAQPGTGNFP